MAVLPDWRIHELASSGAITPFDPDLINPASIDLRLGSTLLIESAESPTLVPYPLGNHDAEHPYLLRPGQFVLAATLEQFNIPPDICAQFILKSSRAREGLDHALAGWADPGWHGSALTVELRNNRQLHSLPLFPGLLIGQMVFHAMTDPPAASYASTGRYNGDPGATGSRG
jgi:dCTP deaminase